MKFVEAHERHYWKWQQGRGGVGNTRVGVNIRTLHTNSTGNMVEDRSKEEPGRGILAGIEELDRAE